MIPAPPATVAGGLLVAAPYRHVGAARRLVHHLKYTGAPEAMDLLAVAMADVIPPGTTALVPVRRARLRRWQYGSDPAALLAAEVGRLVGIEMIDALRPGWWWPRHAGQGRNRRAAPRWAATMTADRSWTLVDDVLTTGTTMQAAAQQLGGLVSRCIVATVAGRVTWEGGTAPVPSSRESA